MAQIGEDVLRKAFLIFDKDGSGKISISEMVSVVQQMGLQLDQKQAQAVMAQYDVNQDGQWDFDEFYEFYMKVVANQNSIMTIDQEIQAVFNLLDANKSGSIDCKELDLFFKQINSPVESDVIQQLIDLYDTNKSGVMEFAEFEKFYKEVKNKTGIFAN